MSTALQGGTPGALTSATPQSKELNAEAVTVIATGFLKRIGHNGGLKPKRVSLEEEVYTVEVEMKKFTALVRINRETHEIKEYEIQPKGEETSYLPVSPKAVVIIVGVSVAVHFALYFALKILDL